MMIDVFTDSATLSLITLSGFRFPVAIIAALVLMLIQAGGYSTDKRFRNLYFNTGAVIFTITIFIHVLLTQYAASGAYRPILVGTWVYDIIARELTDDASKTIAATAIGRALYSDLFQSVGPALGTALLVVAIGWWSIVNPPPRWVRGKGVDVMQAKFPNLVNYTIYSVFIQNIFISATLIFISIIVLDLNQLDAMSRTQYLTPPSFFQGKSFDKRFFTWLGLAPFLLVAFGGSIYRTRYRMLRGGLEQYRPWGLRILAHMQRRRDREEIPSLGNENGASADKP